MKTRHLAATCAALLLLTGCGSDGAADASAPPEDGPAAKSTSVIDRVSSCDQVAGVVGPYIAGLELTDSSTVDQWGVNCNWEPPESATDFSEIRSISVSIVDNEEGSVPPDTSLLADQEGYTDLEDDWVSQQEGKAYSLSMAVAVAGATVTTVWLPHAEISVSGGTWGEHPALDGPAAVEVAKKLMG